MKIKFKSILILLNRKMEINDYPNYLIYEDGRVYSKKRKHFLKPKVRKDGYSQVILSKNNKVYCRTIHRLVALHYIPNTDNKPQVDHIDRNKQNNNISNLRWVTHQENQDNRDLISNTGEKHISHDKINNRYDIEKKNYFRKTLDCRTHTLQDAINLRDSILG